MKDLRVDDMRHSEVKRLVMRRPDLGAASGADGFIIVAVLWILAALAALASVYAVYIANTAMSARIYGHRLKTEALVTAAVELTAYRLIGFDDAYAPKFGRLRLPNWRLAYWRGVPFRGGAHRSQLGTKALAFRLACGAWGKARGREFFCRSHHRLADQAASRATKTQKPTPTKSSWVTGRGRRPFKAPLNCGSCGILPAALVDAALPFVTVFNGKAEIDINEAAPEVIAALPHMNPSTVADILKLRNPQNPQGVLGSAWRRAGERRGGRAQGGAGRCSRYSSIRAGW